MINPLHEPPRFKQIDQDPRRHSHLYELKPMSRWWLVPAFLFVLLCLFVLGFSNINAYAAIFAGALLAGCAVLCFPRYWLSKLRD